MGATDTQTIERGERAEQPASPPAPPSRRALFGHALGAGAMLAAVGALAAGCGSDSGTLPVTNTSPLPTPTPSPGSGGNPADPTDADILNFALNLEYLEAEYYLRGVTGSGLLAREVGGAGAGEVIGGRAVTFASPTLRALFEEIAEDERDHVNFLRNALGGAAVLRPRIDFTAAFNAAAQAAGIGQSFDPFANETNFLLGAFVFEDVGVTAYRGSARFIDSRQILESAAGILAVEAAHAGAVRNLVYDGGAQTINLANQLANLRAQAGGGKDEGLIGGTLTAANGANFAPTDAQARVYGRTVAEVLRIVYLNAGSAGGGFFPQGATGNIRFAA